jgi:hypothetical protein
MTSRAKKISELVAATGAANTDLMVLVANTSGTAVTKRITVNNFITPLITDRTSISQNTAVLTMTSSNGQITNLISNTYVQLQYNPAANAAADTTTNSNWLYVDAGGINVETYDGAVLKSGMYVAKTGAVTLRTGTKSFILSDTVPTQASFPGTAGQVAFDTDYFYYCVAADTWKRVALSTW